MAAMMTSGSCVTSGDLTTVIIIDLVESSQGDQRETAAHDEEHEEEDWGTSVESERWAIRERWETLKRNGYKWTYLNDPALQARFLQRNIVLDDDVYFFIHREKFNFKKDFTPKSLGEDMWMSVKDAWRHWDKVNRLEAFKRFVPPSTPADFTATPSVMEAAIAYVVTPPSPLADASAIQHTSPVIKRPRITKENIDQPQIVSIKTLIDDVVFFSGENVNENQSQVEQVRTLHMKIAGPLGPCSANLRVALKELLCIVKSD